MDSWKTRAILNSSHIMGRPKLFPKGQITTKRQKIQLENQQKPSKITSNKNDIIAILMRCVYALQLDGRHLSSANIGTHTVIGSVLELFDFVSIRCYFAWYSLIFEVDFLMYCYLFAPCYFLSRTV